MRAFYNDLDPYAFEWLRNLEHRGAIAPGLIRHGSIKDVRAEELERFTQCHFFAGVGVWSYALRLAGIPDSFPVWTGSCPCQPWSGTGKRGGFDDPRHLWPDWFRLIDQRRPPVVFGEQVASPDGRRWLDAVHADMAGAGYAFAAADLPAASVGAPHIRQRLYFCAVDPGRQKDIGRALRDAVRGFSGLGDVLRARLEGHARHVDEASRRPGTARPAAAAGPTNGAWSNADWLFCRDGKWRPVEPGARAMAPRTPEHVGRLRAFGNAISPQVAATFVVASLEDLVWT